ncbi:MAG: hypothetical protein B7Y43_18785 [Sphingomonas sp. 28-62-20]|nr:MAG: hypothetical protein B7Y43_18785 [Sphingomonas sp. 28-62-20]
MRPFPLLAFVLIPACAAVPPADRAVRPAPPPPPVTAAPPPAQRPVPSVITPLYRGDWRDWPVTRGDWVYRQDGRGSIALFGPPGGDAELTLRCDRLEARVYLSRRGAAPGNAPMTVRTSSTLRSIATQPTGGSPSYMAASLDPRDTLLDAIGFSRGRFVIEQATLPVLVIPVWAEILRVTEDCRK